MKEKIEKRIEELNQDLKNIDLQNKELDNILGEVKIRKKSILKAKNINLGIIRFINIEIEKLKVILKEEEDREQ